MHADAIGLDLLNLIGQCGKDISHVDAVAAAVRKINTTIKEFNKPKVDDFQDDLFWVLQFVCQFFFLRF